MSSTWMEIATVLTVFTLAIISPGPNFLLVVNRAMADTRRNGLYTALGVATGSALFALAGMFGLILMISTLPWFPVLSRWLGGTYLAWIGFGMLRSTFGEGSPQKERTAPDPVRTQPLQAYRTGLFTNLTNPKAWAFYLSLFALVVSPTIPLWGKTLLVIAMFLISFGWYATVALLISCHLVRPAFLRAQKLIQGAVGLALVWLGGRLLIWR